MMVDFIGIGAQKSGTSWIAECLAEHPEVCISHDEEGNLVKEVHYFDWNYEKGNGWYDKHFQACGVGQKRGEFTPMYLFDPEVPARIIKEEPNAKLLVCLRNPINRAWSQYRAGRAHWTGRDFWEVIEYQPEIIERGYYAEQLKRYLKYFPREQLYIYIYEDIQKDPLAFMQRIFVDLDIDPYFEPAFARDKANVSASIRFRVPLLELVRQYSRIFISKTPLFYSLLKKIGVGHIERTLQKKNVTTTSSVNYTKIPLEIQEYLKKVYEEDVRELESLFNFDLSGLYLK